MGQEGAKIDLNGVHLNNLDEMWTRTCGSLIELNNCTRETE